MRTPSCWCWRIEIGPTGCLIPRPGDAGVAIRMDGRGRVFDNIFTERLWRSVKYEEVYLKDYGSMDAARRGLGEYFGFYNTDRPHQSLGYRTPAEVHFDHRVQKEVLAEA